LIIKKNGHLEIQKIIGLIIKLKKNGIKNIKNGDVIKKIVVINPKLSLNLFLVIKNQIIYLKIYLKRIILN